MAFIDEYYFTAKAGDGGDGVVRFRREKFIPKGGPNGGNGGKGGDVYLRAVRDINKLSRIQHTHEYAAENGHPGEDGSKSGRGGEDLYIELPIGSRVVNTLNGKVVELLKDGETVLFLKGGVGGFGNEHFKGPSNQAPREYTEGAPGESGEYETELLLIADIGLVGLPNAGKTSLLNALTSAEAKVGDYPFTTLDPNLGTYYGLIIADIPGIIEGASEGKGLGNAFLRHISRTKFIVHCISFERENIVETYSDIRDELQKTENLAEKKEFVLFTKSDMLTSTEDRQQKEDVFRSAFPSVDVLGAVSVLDDKTIKELGDKLVRFCKGE